jgi:anti-sigma B factor antagonist
LNGLPRPFQLSIDDTNGRPVVHVTGEVDLDTAPQLEATLLDLAAHGARAITIDLSQTDFIDSTGLHAIVMGAKRLRDQGGELSLASPSKSTYRVLELTGLTSVLPIS